MIKALTSAQANQANQAYSLLAAGDPQSALRIALRLQREAPNTADAQQLAALCLSGTGDNQSAEAAFVRALRLAPRQPAILGNFGKFLNQIGRAHDATVHLRLATKIAPDFAAAWIDLGQAALNSGQHDQAIAALERAVALQPNSVRAWHLLGLATRAGHDLARSEAALRQALRLAPQSVNIWIALGAVLRLLGRPSETLECYSTARQHGAGGPEFANSIIGALIDAGEIGEALTQALELTKLHPDFVAGHVTLAHLLWEYGTPDASDQDAITPLRAVALSRPEDHQLQVALIGFLLGAKRVEEALERIQSLRKKADDPVLVTLQANSLVMLGRHDQATPLYESAYRSLGSHDPNFLNAYVRHLLITGRWQDAAQRASEALTIDANNQEALAYLTTAWRLLEDPRELYLCDYERCIAMLEVEPPLGFASNSEFLLVLEDCLLGLHQARTEPVLQTLRLGSQTPGRLFGRPEHPLAATELALRQTVERWLESLPSDPEHPFLRRKKQSVVFTGSWSVKLRSHGNHVNHIHPEGWMSSAYYVALPPSVAASTDLGDQSGYIQFGQPPVELGLNLPPRRVIKPKIGNLALFPSYLWHGTVPFADDASRITIAFDMLPRA